jgi:hypothetical protein
MVPIESTHVGDKLESGALWGTQLSDGANDDRNQPFGPKTDRNFIFPVLMQGVAVGWASTLYGTSTLALSCPLVWSAGSTWLGLRQKG